MAWTIGRSVAGAMRLALVSSLLALAILALAPALGMEGPAVAQEQGMVPGNTLGGSSDADFWRAIREGNPGTVSIPDDKAAVMIQSEGDNWRSVRNGPLSLYGAWVLLGMVCLVALFFMLRGRVRIEGEKTGHKVERFDGIERFAHWLTAVSFLVLAFTGLNVLYGRYVLKPLIGPDLFGLITYYGKLAHNFVAPAFMLGVVLVFLLWVVHNIPTLRDIGWLLRFGGLLSKHSHPPAKKFNAGQKIIFWAVVLGGLSLSLSGVSLLFPFRINLWGPTFEIVNMVGLSLPTDLTAMQEMQLSQLWHGAVALILIAVIIGHIYIGSIGMEGAFDAMGTGYVEETWAREHHSLWMEELDRKAAAEAPPKAPPSAPSSGADGAGTKEQPA